MDTSEKISPRARVCTSTRMENGLAFVQFILSIYIPWRDVHRDGVSARDYRSTSPIDSTFPCSNYHSRSSPLYRRKFSTPVTREIRCGGLHTVCSPRGSRRKVAFINRAKTIKPGTRIVQWILRFWKLDSVRRYDLIRFEDLEGRERHFLADLPSILLRRCSSNTWIASGATCRSTRISFLDFCCAIHSAHAGCASGFLRDFSMHCRDDLIVKGARQRSTVPTCLL